MKWLILLIAIAGCTAIKPEAPNGCPYEINTGMIVYEQRCDTSNRRNVGEPVCIKGNIIIDDCKATDKQYIITEVLRRNGSSTDIYLLTSRKIQITQNCIGIDLTRSISRIYQNFR